MQMNPKHPYTQNMFSFQCLFISFSHNLVFGLLRSSCLFNWPCNVRGITVKYDVQAVFILGLWYEILLLIVFGNL